MRLQRALVTGASSGIGAEMARQLAGRGVDLVVVARREAALRELAEALGVDVEILPADLTVPEDRERVEQRLAGSDRPVDLLVNNAGFGAYGDLVDLDPDLLTRQIELNVTAVVRLTRAVLPRLVADGRGGVINISSLAGFQPGPHGAVYGATKTFVTRFTEAVHEEVRSAGVRVTVVCPGVVETEFQQVADVDLSAYPSALTTDVEEVVRAALDGFTRRRATVVPGVVNRLAAAGASVSPSRLTARFAGAAHRSFTQGRGSR